MVAKSTEFGGGEGGEEGWKNDKNQTFSPLESERKIRTGKT